MKYLINIQSISDIITNSSSETFCKITADKDTLDTIYDLISPLFGDEYDYDIVLNIRYKEDIEPQYCDNYDKLPEQWLEISLPYRLEDLSVFYKKGLEAILKEHFNGKYVIKYED